MGDVPHAFFAKFGTNLILAAEFIQWAQNIILQVKADVAVCAVGCGLSFIEYLDQIERL